MSQTCFCLTPLPWGFDPYYTLFGTASPGRTLLPREGIGGRHGTKRIGQRDRTGFWTLVAPATVHPIEPVLVSVTTGEAIRGKIEL